jgi:hypothetical protein
MIHSPKSRRIVKKIPRSARSALFATMLSPRITPQRKPLRSSRSALSATVSQFNLPLGARQ